MGIPKNYMGVRGNLVEIQTSHNQAGQDLDQTVSSWYVTLKASDTEDTWATVWTPLFWILYS